MMNDTGTGSGCEEKRRRGRPRKTAMQDSEDLGRTTLVLEFYDATRGSGMKYASAVRETARRVHCSAAEVKRILANLRPRGAERGLVTGGLHSLSEAERERNKALGLPEVFWKNPTVIPLMITTIPRYPRHNARKK